MEISLLLKKLLNTKKMKKSTIIIAILLTFISINADAQSIRKCSTTEEDQKLIDLDPSILTIREEIMSNYKAKINWMRNNPNVKTPDYVYRIPVVVHIMHNYGNSPGKTYYDFLNNRQRYVDAVEEINRVFSNADSNFIQAPFNQIAHKLNIEFYLANKDPQGNLTKGMTFNYDPETESATQAIKANAFWDNKKYLNVWIVNGIESGAGGWSHYPGINDSYDGIVVRNDQLSALAHECGHWLALPHPWGSNNESNEDGNCSLDDGVGDTPNTRGQSNCSDLTRNSCSDSPIPFLDIYGNILWPAANGEIHDNVQNVMDYAFCTRENFTEGQKALVRNVLETTTANGRNTIWNESNLVATGICDTCGPYNFYPKALFEKSVKGDVVCANKSVTFTDFSYDGDATAWKWYFGDGDSSTTQNPSHTYAEHGKYTVKLIASNMYGSSEYSIELNVGAIAGGLTAPFYENFESSDFPTFSDPLKEWVLVNGAPTKWTHTQNVSYSGFGSLMLSLKSITSDKTYELISPPIDFSSVSCRELKFKYAYAKRFTSSKEILNVYVSKDCGETWQTLFQAPAATLVTSDSLYPTSFLPTIDQWKEEKISLATFAGQKNILIKFQIITGNGNTFYIDDVDVGCDAKTGLNEQLNIDFKVFPNPFESDININLSVYNPDNINIKVFDILGKEIYSDAKYFNRGQHTYQLSELSSLEKGVYFISIKSNGQTISKKIVKY